MSEEKSCSESTDDSILAVNGGGVARKETIKTNVDSKLEDLYCALFYSLCDSQICRLSICEYASFERKMVEIDFQHKIKDYYTAFHEITNEFDNSFDKQEFIQFMKNSRNKNNDGNNNNNSKNGKNGKNGKNDKNKTKNDNNDGSDIDNKQQTKLEEVLHNWVTMRYNNNNINNKHSRHNSNSNNIIANCLSSARILGTEVVLPTPLYTQLSQFYDFMFFGNVECDFDCFLKGMILCGFGGVLPEQVFCEIIENGKKNNESNSNTSSKSGITTNDDILENGSTFSKREFIKYCFCDISKIRHTMPWLFLFVAQNPHMWYNNYVNSKNNNISISRNSRSSRSKKYGNINNNYNNNNNINNRHVNLRNLKNMKNNNNNRNTTVSNGFHGSKHFTPLNNLQRGGAPPGCGINNVNVSINVNPINVNMYHH